MILLGSGPTNQNVWSNTIRPIQCDQKNEKMPNFRKNSQKSPLAKNGKISTPKAQFESLKHLYQTTFENLKYLRQTLFWNYLCRWKGKKFAFVKSWPKFLTGICSKISLCFKSSPIDKSTPIWSPGHIAIQGPML